MIFVLQIVDDFVFVDRFHDIEGLVNDIGENIFSGFF